MDVVDNTQKDDVIKRIRVLKVGEGQPAEEAPAETE
jgi:hypothetical protein